MNRSPYVLAACPLLACLVAAACAPSNGEGGGTPGGAGGFGSVPGGSGGVLIGGGGVIGNGGYLQAGGGTLGNGGSGSGGEEACPEVVQQTERTTGKADIIWVLDTSGSMLEEIAGVQANMNAFSDFITKTGIDVHVVAVAIGSLNIIGIQTPGLCLAPPLGSGKQCPDDTNPPIYTHIQQNIDSHDALLQLQNTYPQWQSAIRPDSTKTFVVVTDDEARATPTVADFTAFWNNAWPGSKWRFSGIFCKGPAANCSGIGNMYGQLVDQTGGVWSDMGNPNPDWSGVFKQLGDAVVADSKPVDCEWKIPPIPPGMTFDPDFVNVKFTPSSGVTETLLGVDRPDQCQDATGGWYVDTTRMTVLACPSSCTRMQSDPHAQVAVAFGCARRTEIE